jgi:gas vesicle protein
MTKSDIPGTAFTFALGIGVGAAIALLFAPKSGEEFRGQITDTVNDGVKQVQAAGAELRERAQDFVETATGQVQDAFEAGEAAFQKASRGTTRHGNKHEGHARA